MAHWIAFVGPSIDRAEAEALGAEVRPPARRGDVWRARDSRPIASALIDGLFEGAPSVWHRELLSALEGGVALFGAASMGALRAAELDRLGMVGIGTIYRWVKERVVRDDSEVALLHGPEELAHRPLTLPLVQVRFAGFEACRMKVLRPLEARQLAEAAAAIHYQRRTWDVVLERLPWKEPVRVRFRAFLPAVRDVKREDARACLRTAAEYARAGIRGFAGTPRPASSWQRRFELAHGSVELDGGVQPASTVLASLEGADDSEAVEAVGASVLLAQAFARGFGIAPDHALGDAARLVPDGPSRDEARIAGVRALARWRRPPRES